MSAFAYRAYDKRGRPVQGVIEGPSMDAVSQKLSEQGLLPVSVNPQRSLSVGKWLARSKVKNRELLMFLHELATLQKAGVPLRGSLHTLAEQTKNSAFKEVLEDIVKNIEGGSPLSAAFANHPSVFKPLHVSMIRSGEASGRLDEILLHLSRILEFEVEIREKIKSSTRYPIMAFFSLIIAFVIIVTMVIPKFLHLFQQFKAKLPLTTRLLLGINDLVRHYWAAVLVAGAALFAGFRWWTGTPNGRYQWDFLKLRTPVFGPLVTNFVMGRFAKTLAQLLGAGVPILQALDLVGQTAGNAVIEKIVGEIRHSVNEGKGMAEPMQRSGLFPPMVIQMVEVGSQTGKTAELLDYVGGYYEEQANYILKNLTTMIEPIFILVLGVLILILALGVFVPMWSMVNVVH